MGERGRVRPVAPATAGRPRRDRADRLVAGGGGQPHRAGTQRGDLTGPSPVDRGKPGSKIHALTERGGIPLAVLISAANRNDYLLLDELIDAVPAVRRPVGRPRRRPAKLH